MSLNDYAISKHRDAEFFEHVFPFKRKITDVAPISSSLPIKMTDVKVPEPEPRRSKRHRVETNFGPDFVTAFLIESFNSLDVGVITEEFVLNFLIEEEPKTYQEAITSIDATFWKEAIKSEIESLESNKTWELTDLPKGCRPISSKWIFKKKLRADGSIDKYKARLVIRGFD